VRASCLKGGWRSRWLRGVGGQDGWMSRFFERDCIIGLQKPFRIVSKRSGMF